jgi:hypothetical protein
LTTARNRRIVAAARVNEETCEVITVVTSEFSPAIGGNAPRWTIGDCVGVPLADYGNDSLAGHCLARANHEAYKAAMYRWPVFRRRANAEALASGEPVRDRNNKIVKSARKP